MVLYRFEGKEPKIGKGTYVSHNAEVIGNASIGKQCYVGPGAIVRGDYGTIVIGDKTSIEENCVLHTRPNEICKIGNMVTVGHGATLHNCTVKDSAIIGMEAIVSDYALVGVWAVIAEQTSNRGPRNRCWRTSKNRERCVKRISKTMDRL